MSWAIVVGAGVSLAGAYAQDQSGKSASKNQINAGRNATLAQLANQAQTRADLAPVRTSGLKALDALDYQMGLGRAPMLSYEDWIKANPNIQAQAGAVQGSAKSPDMLKTIFRDLPRKAAGIGDVLHLDPFGSNKKKKKAKQKAAQAQADAQTNLQTAQRNAYDAYVTDYNNSRAADPGVEGDLSRDFTLADFQKDPGYEFRLAEGEKGRNRAAAARGGLVSGAALKELDRYDQDYASGEFSNAYNRFNNDRTTRFNRLSTLAGMGSGATTQLIGSNQNTTNAISDLDTQAGNVAAARDINRGNAQSDAFTSLGNFYLQNRFRGGVAGGAYGTGRGSGGASNFQYNDTSSPAGYYV
jgi:hypothetical protein